MDDDTDHFRFAGDEEGPLSIAIDKHSEDKFLEKSVIQ